MPAGRRRSGAAHDNPWLRQTERLLHLQEICSKNSRDGCHGLKRDFAKRRRSH
jgi:hypothetical protein